MWSSPGTKGWPGPTTTTSFDLTEERLAQTDHPVLFLVGQVGRSYFAGARTSRWIRSSCTPAQDPTLLRAEELSD